MMGGGGTIECFHFTYNTGEKSVMGLQVPKYRHYPVADKQTDQTNRPSLTNFATQELHKMI